MRYYVKETPKKEGAEHTAYTKARYDADKILNSLGFAELEIKMTPYDNEQSNHFISKIKHHWNVYKAWRKCTAILQNGDILLLQFPCIDHTLLFFLLIRELSKSGVTILLLIHDLELLRVAKEKSVSFARRVRIQFEERTVLNSANKIIAHNQYMITYMQSLGIKGNKLVSLGLFDYLVDNYDDDRMKQRQISNGLPIVIAGNLSKRKAGYIYKLPKDLYFNLYGTYYSGVTTKRISYKGAFSPEDIPYKLNGSFGLIWDGDSVKTCSGVYGSYMKINNPHKLSLYLASGMPVIIWSQAALADFVIKNGIGITVDSLISLKSELDKISDDRYEEMRCNAENIGKKLRQGFYLKTAIGRCQ